jgi:hypothetical protein
MRSWIRIGSALGLLAATAAGCAVLAGIEDLQLTDSTDDDIAIDTQYIGCNL